MNSKIIIIQFLFLIILGCKPQEASKGRISNYQDKILQDKNVPNHLKNWAIGINENNIDSIKHFYDINAVKINSPDNIIEGSSQIANYFKAQKEKITSIKSLFSVEANSKRKINYELVSYKTDDQKEFIGIVIWKVENEKIIREFEFTKESSLDSKKVDTANISERRKLWIQLCNENNPKNLIKELYSSNIIYYNHKPLVKGTDDLIKEYSYMDNKNYHLKLHPLTLKTVNASFAFEIGQCTGSYNGKYIIVWEKGADGKWKIIVDSNI
ncbi:hypothetical protein OZ664_08625 [Elizabethkingia sp. HX WHF]|uniref:hypothetical protein n=1 Tax=Elizabethkingia TaxID=308865 RepID=UPI00099973EB|nr:MULTISPECIES: hypothetical protein [Elizabethkingia]ATL44974.1 hypothetical protein CQS02_17500 [Elizabethkingia miricola]MCL1636735.1 hypothetical protein [Elizabethkingia bruuniana]MDX8564062.1 hypothetical protein [Elizabethkingia sp. HX WHF]OPC18822.1 hypothetical protein BAY00_13510 [Elizabethkingia bruuniana]